MLAHFGTVYYYDMFRAASVLGLIIAVQCDIRNLPKYPDAMFCTISSRENSRPRREESCPDSPRRMGHSLKVRPGLRCRISSLLGVVGVVRGICQIIVAWM